MIQIIQQKKNDNPYIEKTTLIFPYFIESPMDDTIDREQIEIFINNEINKKNSENKDKKKDQKILLKEIKFIK